MNLGFAAGLLFACSLNTFAFVVFDTNDVIRIATTSYQLEITKQNFRCGFKRPDGSTIAPPNAAAGLEFGGGRALAAKLVSSDAQSVLLEVINDQGAHAAVEIEPGEHHTRLAISQPQAARIIVHIGGISPVFGLADHAALGEHRAGTEITGFGSEEFRAQEPPGDKRLISNFIISPRHGFAMVNLERAPKIIRVLRNDVAQGVVSAKKMSALYFFMGTPPEIYAAFLAARNREGFPVLKPKYELFGVGWEAFGALGWKTNEKTVTENVDHYLALGYPLSWMVVGSGFWPNDDLNFGETTSFGLWDKIRYPDPKNFITHFHERGLKFFLGLRIGFIKDGPFSAEGVSKNYFLKENGVATAWKLGFPKLPAYLLDGSNPAAVKWYCGLVQKWRDFGVDGFKEDLFGYKIANAPDGNINFVNEALMRDGVFIMGRNSYVGSPCDIHRINDFNFNQNQDRGPINVLALAYSGFPYAYPDIVGGTFGEGRKMPPRTNVIVQNYMMRAAQFDSVNPAMAMGMGPWNFGSAEVEHVILEAAQRHARLHPYIFSAAMDTYATGFPFTMTPLAIAYPEDASVYERENDTVRGYEWMFGPSLLACPLYGDDYATAKTRDVYLPAGKWMDYDTGEIFIGPKLLQQFALPVGKTPLFVGGKGVLVTRELPGESLRAKVYPVAPRGSAYHFTHRDGTTCSTITSANSNWQNVVVVDATEKKPVTFEREPPTGAVCFSLTPGHDYNIQNVDRAAATTAPSVIVVFGDSITAGGMLPPSERSNLWLQVIERESGGRLKMINEGKGGRPTASVKEFEAMLQRQPAPDLLVIALGANDSRNTNSDCVPKAVANLRTMILKARDAYGAKLRVLLASPLNINKAALGPTKIIGNERTAKLRELGAALAELAQELNCEFVNWYGVVPDACLTRDGVHPDSAGNAAIARVMQPKLFP